jgi:hypothetical protein
VARFTTPDPSAAGDPSDPQSWNRYAYVQGDPVNFADSSGLFREPPKMPPPPTIIILWNNCSSVFDPCIDPTSGSMRLEAILAPMRERIQAATALTKAVDSARWIEKKKDFSSESE